MDANIHKIKVDKFYDDLSEIWDKTRPKYTEGIFRKIIARLDKIKPYLILDFGCGTGLLCKYLHENLPNAKVDGIDISSRMIEKAKANCPDCKFYAGNVLSVHLPEYGLVVSKDVFNHIEDIPKTIRRLDELLNKGGGFIIANRERDKEVKGTITGALRQLGYRILIERFSLKPTKKEIDTFMAGIPTFKEEHKALVRKKLEESGEYYIIFADK